MLYHTIISDSRIGGSLFWILPGLWVEWNFFSSVVGMMTSSGAPNSPKSVPFVSTLVRKVGSLLILGALGKPKGFVLQYCLVHHVDVGT